MKLSVGVMQISYSGPVQMTLVSRWVNSQCVQGPYHAERFVRWGGVALSDLWKTEVASISSQKQHRQDAWTEQSSGDLSVLQQQPHVQPPIERISGVLPAQQSEPIIKWSSEATFALKIFQARVPCISQKLAISKSAFVGSRCRSK